MYDKNLVINDIAKKSRHFVAKKLPVILTGVGISSMIFGTATAIKQTPKAIRLLDEDIYFREKGNEEFLKEFESDEDFRYLDYYKPIDLFKITWQCYTPTLIAFGVSTLCFIGLNSVHNRRSAALTAAYTISETALKNYKEKVVEVVGEKKEQKIREEVVKEKLRKDPVENKEVIITNKGETLCYDGLSGRYFKSDKDSIDKAVNYLNKRLIDEMYISLNTFYYELGLTGLSIGEDLGWNLDDGIVEIDFGSILASDGTPCLTLEYRTKPRHDYSFFA